MNTNPVKAIREYCLSCCLENANEVKMCPASECALYAFRFGKNPYRTKRVYTEDQKAKLAANLPHRKKLTNISGTA